MGNEKFLMRPSRPRTSVFGVPIYDNIEDKYAAYDKQPIYVPAVNPIKETYKGTPYVYKSVNPLLSNYNDPNEINSFADVLLNAINENSRRPGYGNSPISKLALGSLDLLWQRSLKPVLKGDFKTFGLNTLINFSETMDILANPVKGYVYEGKEGVLKSLGLTGEGRTNYDVNTGNIVTDILGELVADPLNWISLGGAMAVKSSVKGTTEMLQAGAKEFVGAVDDKVYKKIAKNAARAYIKGDYASMDTALRELTANFAKSGKYMPKGVQRTEDFIKAMDKMAKASETYVTDNVLRSVSKLVKPQEAFESFLLKQVGNTSGIRPTWQLAKKGFDFVNEKWVNRTYSVLKPYLNEKGMIDIYKFDEATETLNNHIINQNFANKLAKEAEINPNIAEALQRQSIEASFTAINDALTASNGDFRKFNDSLNEFFKRNDADALQSYIQELKKINAKYDDRFTDLLDMLEEGYKYIDDLRYADGVKTKQNIASMKSKLFDVMSQDVDKVLGDNSFVKGSLAQDIDSKLYSLETKHANLYKDTSLLKDSQLKVVKDNMEQGINQLNERYFDKVRDLLTDELYYYKGNKVYNAIADDYSSYIDDFIEDLFKQYDDKYVGSVTQVLSGVKRAKPSKLNIDMDKVLKGLDDILAKHSDDFTKYFQAKYLSDQTIHLTKLHTEIKNLFTSGAIAEHIEEIAKHNEDLINKTLEFSKIKANEAMDFTKLRTELKEMVTNRLDQVHTQYKNPGFYNPTQPEVMAQVDEFIKATDKHLNRVLTQIDKVYSDEALAGALIKGRELPHIDLTNKQIKKLKFNMSENARWARYQMNQLAGDVDIKELNKFKDFNDMLTKQAAKQGRYVDNFLKHCTRSSELVDNVTFKLSSSGVKVVTDIRKDLTNLFKDDAATFIESVAKSKNLEVHAEMFENAIADFLHANLDDINEFTDAWLDLTNAINRLTVGLKTQGTKVRSKTGTVIDTISQADAARSHGHATASKVINEAQITKHTKTLDTVTNLKANIKNMSIEDVKVQLARIRIAVENEYKFSTKTITEIDKVLKLDNITPNNLENIISEFKSLAPEAQTVTMEYKNLADVQDVEFVTQLDSILAKLNDCDPVKIVDGQLTVQAEGVYRQLKLEQTYTTHSLMNIETLNGLMADIRYNVGPGALLNDIAKMGTSAPPALSNAVSLASDILQEVEELNNYKTLLDRLARVPVPEETKAAFISTIQNYAEKNPNLILANMDYHISEMFERTENYMYGSTMKESLAIEKLLAADGGELEKIMKELMPEGTEHTAIYDIEALEQIIYKYDLHRELNKTGATSIIFDIETTGAEPFTGNVFEIGIKEMGVPGTTFSKKLEPGVNTLDNPSTRILNKFYPESDPRYAGLNEMEKLELFKKRSGELTEQEVLQNMIDFLKSYGGPIQLVGHNSDKFDVGFLKNRMRANGISNEDITFFEHLSKKDTLTMLKEKNGYKAVTQAERDTLTPLLHWFIEAQTKGSSGKLISTASGELSNNLKNLAKELEDTIRTSNRKNFVKDRLSEAAVDGLDDFESYNHVNMVDLSKYDTRDIPNIQLLNRVATDISEQLQSISRMNKSLQYDILTPGAFEDGTYLNKLRQYLDANKEQLTKELGITEKQLFDKFGEYLNPSKLMYGLLPEGVNTYGYKNVVDMGLITEWWNFKPNDTVNMRTAKAMTSIGKGFDRIRASIKHPEMILPHGDKIKEALKIIIPGDNSDFLEAVLRGENPTLYRSADSFYSKIRTDKDDPISNFVLLRYLYNSLKNKKKMTGVITNKIAPEVMELLEDHSGIIFKAGNAKAYEKMVKTTLDKGIANPQAIKAIAEDMKNAVTSIEDLGKQFDNYTVYRAKTQALSSSVMPVYDMLQLYGEKLSKMTANSQAKYVQDIKLFTNHLARQQTFQVLTLPPQELFKLMVNGTPWIEFGLDTVTNDATYKRVVNELMEKTTELKANGIELIMEKNRAYLALSKDVKVSVAYDGVDKVRKWYANGNYIPRPALKDLDYKLYGLEDTEMLEAIIKSKDQLGVLSNGSSVGSLGDMLTRDKVQLLYDQLPDKVKKLIPNKDTLFDFERFTDRQYNFMSLGYISDRMAKSEYTSSTIISSIKNSVEQAALGTKTEIQYMQLYFSPEFSINTGWLSEVPEKELVDYLKTHDEFVLSALVEDAKAGYKIITFNPSHKNVVEQARKLNAVIMPRHTLNTAASVISGDVPSQTRKLWNKLIYSYKVGYLLDPGVWFRNYMDSTLKNMIDNQTGLEIFKKQAEAAKAIKLYDKVVNDVLNLSQYDLRAIEALGVNPKEVLNLSLDLNVKQRRMSAARLVDKYKKTVDDILRMDTNRMFTQENLEFYFKHMNPEIDMESFKFIDGFIKDGPSAGMTKTLQDYFVTGRMDKEGVQGLWNTYVHWSSKLMSPNSWVEQINRLAEYMLLADRGVNNTEAFARITKTHFDYSVKSGFAKKLETVIPFYNFTMKNLEYWVEAASSNAWIARLIEDVMAPAWDFDEHSQYELSMSKSLQYQILSGNIPLMPNGMTLKLSSSFMDAYSILYDPVNTMAGKVFSPIKNARVQIGDYKVGIGVGSDYMGPKEETDGESGPTLRDVLYSLPTIGTPLQRYTETGLKYYERTGNPLNAALPGIFGATKQMKFMKPFIPRRYLDAETVNLMKYNAGQKPDYWWLKKHSLLPQRQYNRYGKGGSRYSKSGGRGYSKKTYANKTFAQKSYTPSSYRPFGMNDVAFRGQFNLPPFYNNYNSTKDVGIYRKHYTAKGKSRMAQRMRPVTSQNLKYRIKDYYYYFK